MKNKAIVPTLIMLVFALALVTFFLNAYEKKKPSESMGEVSTRPTAAISPLAQSTLVLTPNPVYLDANGTGIIHVDIETNANEVTAIQLELQYDPKAITNVRIKPSQFFASPVELMKRIDRKNGKITYMVGISPLQKPIKGRGTVAEISFKKVPSANFRETEFTFSRTANAESIVAATGVDLSVLKSTYGTKILLNP